MSLPMNLSAVMSAFQSPVPVYAFERDGFKTPAGIWQNGIVAGSKRKLTTPVILQLDRQELALMVSGDVAEGGISIQTPDTLYFNTSTEDRIGLQGKQSFIEYQGFTFRVIATGFTSPNATHQTYYAVRYQSHGGDQN